jgi:hypothetical protein
LLEASCCIRKVQQLFSWAAVTQTPSNRHQGDTASPYSLGRISFISLVVAFAQISY